MTDLSPTDRTRITRLPERGLADREELLGLPGRGLIGARRAWTPATTRWPCRWPTASTRTAPTRTARSTCTARSPPAGCARRPGTTVCVTVTAVDGLVLARSGFHHSMNYRCAVVIGAARLVESRGRAGPRARPRRRPGRAGPVRDAARAHPQGAGRDRRARRTPARGLAEGAHRRRRRRARGRRGRRLGRGAAAAHASRARSRPTPDTSSPVPDDVAARAGSSPVACDRVRRHVPHPRPPQARHRPPRAGGGGPVPLRGQGAHDRRDGAPHHRRRRWPTSTTPSTSSRTSTRRCATS